ncbi:MAG: hypothetical protein J6A99_03710 [Clostridia bacterium]|nr:hypothetical protein [Clostridia bacterium]
MNDLILALSPTVTIAIIVIAIIAGIAILGAILNRINIIFRARYKLSLWGGACLMMVAEILVVVGILWIDNKIIKIVMFVVAGILAIITLIYNIKKAKGMEILALLMQMIFSIGCPFRILGIFTRQGRRELFFDRARDDHRVRRYREEHGIGEENQNDNFDDIYRN